uniref:Ubiquitin-like domain-containing protein n=1 Tax=Salmo trutta TaxID=8032 RepID=A0A673YMI1_SALTR
MLVSYVTFNSSHGNPVELEKETSIAPLREMVGRLQGVQPEQLRVNIFSSAPSAHLYLSVELHFPLTDCF